MIGAIYKKEMKSFLRSPFSYIILGLFSLVVGWLFFTTLMAFVETTQKMSVGIRNEYDFANQVITKLFGQVNFLLLFVTPLLSMKIFSEEYRQGTIDLYFVSPVKNYELVMAKYLALCTQGALFIATTLIFPVILANIQISDGSFLFYGYIGLILNMFSYLAVGLLASSLSRNQIFGSLITFICILFTWMMSWMSQLTSNFVLSKLLGYISILTHYEAFMSAKISSADITFYISFILIFYILTLKKFESRSW